jgi:hypothetical protein
LRLDGNFFAPLLAGGRCAVGRGAGILKAFSGKASFAGGQIPLKYRLMIISLVLWLAAGLLHAPHLFAFASVSFIVLLASIGCPSRKLLAVFWLWLNLVLFYLLEASPEYSLLAWRLPGPALWMLVGIGVVPILIWPLGFALTFRKWMGR